MRPAVAFQGVRQTTPEAFRVSTMNGKTKQTLRAPAARRSCARTASDRNTALGTCAQSGVTLIELLITLAVAAILVSIAVPSFQAVTRTNRLAAATNELVRALQLARSEAVTRGVRVTVCKSNTTDEADSDDIVCNTGAAWTDGWVVFLDVSNDGANAGARDDPGEENILRIGQPSITGSDDLTIDGYTRFADYVSYLPDGVSDGAGGSNGSLCVSIGADERRIAIGPTGRIRTEQDNCP